jgi:PhoH-like ATPase
MNDKADNKIIYSALNLQEKGETVFFVSKDINARVKASALGIKAVDYKKQTVNINDFYPGSKEYKAEKFNKESVEKFFNGSTVEWDEKLLQNQYILMSDETRRGLGRYDSESGTVSKISYAGDPISGISPLNDRQKIAFDMLLDDSIKLVSLVGKAGTGKTLLAIAAGIQKVLAEKIYTRVLVSRPVIPMGKDIGYLPGDKEEKMSHWMQPIFDNLSQIIEAVPDKQEQKNMENIIKNKQIEIEALTYIRGRSLPNQYIIIDEAQNLTPHEIKTVVSRAGEVLFLILQRNYCRTRYVFIFKNNTSTAYSPCNNGRMQ